MSKQITKEIEVAGKKITLEINKLAPQTNISVIARTGDTEILATVVAGAAKPGQGFFPLTVDFVERLYAGGIIKGSRWIKREGRPTDEAILTGRLVDRSIRPLFPADYFDEVQLTLTLLSTDGENDHDVLSLLAAATALHLSNIPWNGPIGAVRVGFVPSPENGGSFVINPQTTEAAYSDLDLIVAANGTGVVMVEAAAKQLPEEKVREAIAAARRETDKICRFLEELREEVGEKKYPYIGRTINKELAGKIEKDHAADIEPLTCTDDPCSKPKTHQIEELKAVLQEEYSTEADKGQIPEIIETIIKKRVRKNILDKKKRPDGRGAGEVRPLAAEVSLLPRTHGSAVFQRGLTQVLSVVTLASPSLEQWIETAEGMEEKQYIHHYSDPPYALGETGRMGSPGRREIGHGALAEKALLPVVPSQEKFPYTIRVVSEILSSNGSTSMGAACGSTLALMDAGVPVSAPVSGVAMGLVAENEKDFVILTDIAAFEDFYGNMDFKIAGTEKGITAMQLDVKVNSGFSGLTAEMIAKILPQAREGRMIILGKMLSVIPESRQSVSQYAPKVVTVKIPVEKIGEIIGPGGKTIRNITATTGATVDVDDDGLVTLSAIDGEAVERARKWVEGMTHEVQVGEEFEGEVKRILDFGAFVEILPGKEGLVRISQMGPGYVARVEDVVQIGQKVKVKVMEIDELGRVNLTMNLSGSNQAGEMGRPMMRREYRPRPFGRGRPGGRPFGGYNRGPRDDYRGGRRDRY